MQISYTAADRVREAINALGRSEDVKFSPNNKRLALAGYAQNKILVLDVCMDFSTARLAIDITGFAVVGSPYLKRPHGVDFIDDETIVVACRKGSVPILKLPNGDAGGAYYELEPIQVIGQERGLESPGSVSVMRRDGNLCDVLICNNRGNNVTKHVLDVRSGCAIKDNIVLFEKWLDVPDGICGSPDLSWIAVSNHKTHSVFLYDNTQSLGVASEPDGILRCVCYPHGVRFAPDGRSILVADAGAPYVHIYQNDGESWRGVWSPRPSVRVLTDKDFLRGRYNPMEGGPKGVDVNSTAEIMVATNEVQPLAFYFVGVTADTSLLGLEARSSPNKADQELYALQYELLVLADADDKINKVKKRERAQLAKVTNSMSWRMTAPLRSLESWAAVIKSQLRIFRPGGK